MRPATFFTAALIASALSIATFAAHSGDGDLDARARAIDARVLKIDAHTDVLLPGAAELNYAPGHTSRTDLDNLRTGGIAAVAYAIAVGPGARTPEGTKAARSEADAKLAWIQSYVKEHSDRVAVALSANDIEQIHAAGKVAVIESFLNARSIGNDISAIDAFYGQGVRLFGLTHAGNNDWADSRKFTSTTWGHSVRYSWRTRPRHAVPSAASMEQLCLPIPSSPDWRTTATRRLPGIRYRSA